VVLSSQEPTRLQQPTWLVEAFFHDLTRRGGTVHTLEGAARQPPPDTVAQGLLFERVLGLFDLRLNLLLVVYGRLLEL
jgi:hypothetical protein